MSSISLRRTAKTILGIVLAACALPIVAIAVDAPAEPGFPPPSRSHPKGGDFIALDQARRIRPGMNKDQVRLQIGNPHFSEGIFHVRQWNYVFDFYTGVDDAHITCQFRVDFDDTKRVAETQWSLPQCRDLVERPAPIAESREVSAPKTAPMAQRITLDAGGFFTFAKSGLDDLQTEGRRQLDVLVDQIKQGHTVVLTLIITGHADRIGSDRSNLLLSRARAATVRDYLIEHGIDGSLIRVLGAGSTQPIVICPDRENIAELQRCLQPNRRIEVEAIGAS